MTQTTENLNERNYKQQTTYYSLTQKYLNERCNQLCRVEIHYNYWITPKYVQSLLNLLCYRARRRIEAFSRPSP